LSTSHPQTKQDWPEAARDRADTVHLRGHISLHRPRSGRGRAPGDEARGLGANNARLATACLTAAIVAAALTLSAPTAPELPTGTGAAPAPAIAQASSAAATSIVHLPALLADAPLGAGHDHTHPPTPTPGPSDSGAGFGDCDAMATGDASLGETIFRRDCTRCHTFGGGDHRAPDLLGADGRRPRMWLTHWLEDSEYMASWNPYAQRLVATWGYTMPDTRLGCADIASVLDFIQAQSSDGPLEPTAPMALSEAELESTAGLYFDRCAGCHGASRAGGIGPEIGPERSAELGTGALASAIRLGLPDGMPAFGSFGVLTEEEIARLAAYLQLPVPEAPPLPLDVIAESWDLVVPVDDRPSEPEHSRDHLNYFGVVLRESGQVAIFDGDDRSEVGRVDGGFATHILRASASGRLLYSVGRDGWVTAIDLFADPPSTVARVRGCHDARSIESSKAPGYDDRYLIQGCYAPAQYIVYDGQTLEPLARVDLEPGAGTDRGGGTPTELRVGAIAGSPHEPLWVMNLKEAGEVAIIDYSVPGFPIESRIPTGFLLHDGGWDHTQRFFLAAAPTADSIVAIDVEARTVAGLIGTGSSPHPGRGANWEDPEFGWVNATTHLGEGKLTVYGADPIGRPAHAWRPVREIDLPAAGGLFLKTHPRSPWVLMDAPMSTDESLARQICAYSKTTGDLERCFEAAGAGRAVHFEFNREGTHVWVSTWDPAGEVVIYDATTLEPVHRLSGLETPTGKFNVYNTAHDVY